MAASACKRRQSQYLSVDEVIRTLTNDDIPSDSDDDNLVDEEEDRNDDNPSDGDGDSFVSDSGSEDESYSSDEQQTSKRNRRDGGTPLVKVWHWVKKDLPPHVNPENRLIPRGPAIGAKSPLDMFLAHLSNEAFELLTLESNRFMLQLGRTRTKQISVQEMRIVVGICFYMSIVILPNRRMYWSSKTRQPIVVDAITVNRFEEVLSVLHENDNELMKNKGEPGYDRLHKIRPLLEIIGGTFQNCAEPELFTSVDEQMIPFKGRHSLRVYMMKKPKKWGYKVWVLAGQSGYVHRFQFAGDNTVQGLGDDIAKSVGKAGEIVLKLTQGLPDQSYVFFDNYFASPDLLIELRQRQLFATCTIRANRIRKCPLLCTKDMKKKGRGAYAYRSDDNVLICQWYDNKVVMVASNVHGVEPTYEVRRYDGKQKKHINVQCPGLIKSYNANMGGVDKCDMLLALYRNEQKSKKWYKRILFHLLDLCVVNSWLLNRVVIPDCRMQLAEFKLEIARALILQRDADKQYIGPVHGAKFHSARGVNQNARYDLVDHFPLRNKDTKNGQRCKLEGCSRKSLFMCRKCQVYLCLTSKDDAEDCFHAFHH